MPRRLTSRQRSHLRRLAHGLRPVVQVGKEGVGPEAVGALEDALRTRELVKVRVQETSPDPVGEVVERLAGSVPGATAVFTIGRVGVLYRPDPEEPRIELPERGDA